MSPAQLARIPDRLLHAQNTEDLREFLYARGWSLSLYDLDTERRRRKGLPPAAPQIETARKHKRTTPTDHRA